MINRNPTSRKPSTKQIRIGTAHYSQGIYHAARPVPYIRLRGDWLAKAGFAPNDLVLIRVARGRLVITRA
ncbi:type I toxin-antitoxin system SymE family toxin [Tahibacter soli]|uniref:Type I toxin-antitoxin system SymE family toxin n=1 Tax=Tahibacter soli TaxID=2983605 RepID=A0A9X3YHS4_9GAMM|nr:type I toxin-antitoxin system SymE family toxin [Tahibacter soli]MDC8012531.1 type I toxin-antitoxin system SymE family toxin [Tahibacter soli]